MATGSDRDEALTAEVLRLRRRDEAAALSGLQASRRQLESALARLRQAESHAAHCIQAAAQSEGSFAALSGLQLAGELHAVAQELRHKQDERERAGARLASAQAELERCREAVTLANQTFLQRRGQREAAELFAAQQADARRRLRGSRTRILEEEARDRFASGKPRR